VAERDDDGDHVALTPDETASVLEHLGWPNSTMIETMILGFPASREPLFLVIGAIYALNPTVEDRVRLTLKRLDRIESLIDEDADTLVASKTDDTELRPDQFEALLQRYSYWQGKLCNFLGVPGPNPFDSRISAWNQLGGGSVNVRVNHG